MFDVKNFGSLSSNNQYKKKVSISYDTIHYDSDAEIKVLVQIEPPSVLDIISDIKLNYDKFDLILTWNDDLLNLPNARKFVFGCCWIDWDTFKLDKKKVCSFNTSDKAWAPGHKIRHQIWDGLEDADNLNGFDIIKYKSPPRTESKNFLFESAKYNISVENEKKNDWITEKLIDCFATKTIPIYWGALNVGDYFNPDGILTFDSIDELKDILDNLDEKFYDSRIDIIEQNYEESKKYWDFHSRIKIIVEEFINERI